MGKPGFKPNSKQNTCPDLKLKNELGLVTSTISVEFLKIVKYYSFGNVHCYAKDRLDCEIGSNMVLVCECGDGETCDWKKKETDTVDSKSDINRLMVDSVFNSTFKATEGTGKKFTNNWMLKLLGKLLN